MKQEHKYAQVLRWIADGEKIQVNVNGWTTLSKEGALRHILTGTHNEFRLAPRTIIVNGVEVPAPEVVKPQRGTKYYVSTVERENTYYLEAIWDEHCLDRFWLNRGLVYLNKEDAIARAKAMLIAQE